MTPKSSQNSWYAVQRGAVLGVVLALIYSAGLGAAYDLVFLGVSSAANPQAGNFPAGALFIMSIALVIGLVIGLIPGSLIGAITGWLINRLISQVYRQVTSTLAFGVGSAIALGILVLAITAWQAYSYWFWPDTQAQGVLIFLIGLPGIFYVLSGGFFAQHLRTKKRLENSGQNSGEPPNRLLTL